MFNPKMPLAFLLALMLTLGFVAGQAFTEDEEDPEAAMMQALLELHKPGPAQEALDPMAGTWDVSVKMWMGGGEPTTSEASATVSWILDGRILAQEFDGSFAGMPFQGRGFLCHDNHKGEYQAVWFDSFSSGAAIQTGEASEDGKTFTFRGRWESPMGDFDQRYVYTIKGPDTWMMESYASQGEMEWKEMELTYQRRAE